MKKIVIILLSLSAIVIVAMAGVVITLTTPAATSMVNLVLHHSGMEKVRIEQVRYQFPWHLTLNGVSIQLPKPEVSQQPTSDNTWYLPQIDLWASPQVWSAGRWQLNSVLVDGVNLRQLPALGQLTDQIEVEQIALRHFDLAIGDVVLRDANLQIRQPEWQSADQKLPYGAIQLSSEQLYLRGQAFNKLLIDGQFKPADSTIYGFSFQWRGSELSGQAEQYPDGWSLINVTASKLKLDQQALTLLQQSLAELNQRVQHINSLDLLSSSLQLGELTVNNLDASLENITLDHSLWQQSDGYLSFEADNLNWGELQLVSPRARLSLDGGIHIEEFDTDLLQGRLQLSGTITPESIGLKQLSLDGVKWLGEPAELPELPLSLPSQFTVDRLDVHNSQFIQLNQSPYWQLSGLYIDGQQLELIRNDQPGLWQGKAEITVNSASYDQWRATQSVMESHADNGDWYLDRLMIPLEQGYLDASGHWQRGQANQPWQLDLHLDGFPTELVSNWLPEYLELSALLDLEASGAGFSGNYPLFAHSLNGKATVGLREATLIAQDSQPQLTHSLVLPLELDSLQLRAKRGMITASGGNISGPELTGQLQMAVDLVELSSSQVQLNIKQPCQLQQLDLLTGTITAEPLCSDRE
ncbi:AsmA family protein [Vibrio sp.]|uniref:AsmA family protein n=1 Tax=Vibrio sp. TaxID=678 RepID=UPI003D0D562C